MHRGIPTESARVTTTIDTGHPLFNTRNDRLRIQAVLRHLGSGGGLRDFPASASASEKVALVKTANQRGLIAWHKGRGRYELTPAGWCELAPTRRFGVGSMVLGTTVGATLAKASQKPEKTGAFTQIGSYSHIPVPIWAYFRLIDAILDMALTHARPTGHSQPRPTPSGYGRGIYRGFYAVRPTVGCRAL